MTNWKAPGCKLEDTRHDGCNQNKIDSLVRKAEIITKDKGVRFVIEKCGVLAMKRDKKLNAIE